MIKAGIKNNPSLLTPIDKPKIINDTISIFFFEFNNSTIAITIPIM